MDLSSFASAGADRRTGEPLAKVQTHGAAHEVFSAARGTAYGPAAADGTSANGADRKLDIRGAASGSSPVHNNRCTSAI